MAGVLWNQNLGLKCRSLGKHLEGKKGLYFFHLYNNFCFCQKGALLVGLPLFLYRLCFYFVFCFYFLCDIFRIKQMKTYI